MVKEILTDYINFIRAFEALLKDKYKSDKNPCSFSRTFFDRRGTIEGIDYYFHGSGCTAQKDGVFLYKLISAKFIRDLVISTKGRNHTRDEHTVAALLDEILRSSE